VTNINRYFKSKKRLDCALRHISRCPELEEYLIQQYFQQNVEYWSEDVFNGLLFDPPYNVYEEKLGFDVEDTFAAQYVPGYDDCQLHIKWSFVYNYVKSKWEYVDYVPLPEELEIQTIDEKLCYYYMGPGFLRIWKKVNENVEMQVWW